MMPDPTMPTRFTVVIVPGYWPVTRDSRPAPGVRWPTRWPGGPAGRAKVAIVDATPGVLALVGGAEWTPGCDFDAELLAASGGDEVLVLPTAAAYEHPERTVMTAGTWFETLGARVEGLMVLSRADAEDEGAAAVVRRARFVYLSGGSRFTCVRCSRAPRSGRPCVRCGPRGRWSPGRRPGRWS